MIKIEIKIKATLKIYINKGDAWDINA